MSKIECVSIPLAHFKKLIARRRSCKLLINLLAIKHGSFTTTQMEEWLAQYGEYVSDRSVRRAIQDDVKYGFLEADGNNSYKHKDVLGVLSVHSPIILKVPLISTIEIENWWTKQNIKDGNSRGYKDNGLWMGVGKEKARNMIKNTNPTNIKGRKGYVTDCSTEKQARQKVYALLKTNKFYVFQVRDSDTWGYVATSVIGYDEEKVNMSVSFEVEGLSPIDFDKPAVWKAYTIIKRDGIEVATHETELDVLDSRNNAEKKEVCVKGQQQ